MKFYLPDWDDRVDPGYDFATERFTLHRNPYSDDLYAHEVMSDRVYDGVLVSRMAIGESGPKRRAVERIGMRSYLRLPSDMHLIGDCGAFGYMRERLPKFDTDDLVAYYGRLGFDLGVSVDHAIVPEFDDQRAFRYDLTLRNAEAFLREHRSGNHGFMPVGAIQGWDVPSYVEAARAVIAMGFDYLAIGGLARSRTRSVDKIVRAIVAEVPAGTRIHVFGISRPSLLAAFVQLGVASVDSASPVRQAWLSATDNYYYGNRTYTALRIPISVQERAVQGTLVARAEPLLVTLRTAEREALGAVREYDRGQLGLKPTLRTLMAYDRLLALRREGQQALVREELYRQTLRDRPWKLCGCTVCRELGVEVIIFRGNNRNRRRGFHNLWIVQRRLESYRGTNVV